MSNSFDADHVRCSFGNDLGPNCLQRLSADDTSRQRNKQLCPPTLVVFFCNMGGYYFPLPQKVWMTLDGFVYLFVCFVALRPKSTAMVMTGRSVHLTTLFPRQA